MKEDKKLTEELTEKTIKVKMGGDGARMTKVTNFLIISFSVLNDENSVMSAKGKEKKIFFILFLKQFRGLLVLYINIARHYTI